ncbi:anti-virulence regulator CigR family protein [Pseudomonas sp. Pseusp3]|uniref:anti-virulence regulator CigR family protein n=1 Tax=Pseudomonas sp. Pseusp3 TaxID=3243029 RepID=UPI0039AEDC6D
MKMSKRLMAGLGVLLLGTTLHANADQHDDHGRYDNHGDYHGDERRVPQDYHHGGPPPRDFAPVRQAIHDNHVYFVRGAPPPPGVIVVRGRPLPRGYYGERLDNRALSRLPYYPGYEWRRAGADVVLIAAGTGIVYEVLQGVLY